MTSSDVTVRPLPRPIRRGHNVFGGNGEDKLWEAVRGDKPVALLFTGRVVGKG